MRKRINLLSNPIFLFTITRYASYGIQFLRGLLIAKFLGPYYFGIWGFLTLSLQYLSYTNFGIQYAVTVEMSTDSDTHHDNQIPSVAFSVTVIFAILLSLLGYGFQIISINLFEKYNFNQYVFSIFLITGLTHLQLVLTNIYRIYRRLSRIALIELISAITLLLVAIIFEGEYLIDALLVAMVVSGLFSIFIYLFRPPIKISFTSNLRILKSLFVIGMPLLIYNVSFYLIMVSARTILSIFYSVETMGYYSFANAITTATLLGLSSIVWVMFPEILSRTHEGIDNRIAKETVDKVNNLYGTSVFLVVFAMIFILPVIFLFLPQYKPALNTVTILLLSQAILSLSFGYNSVAIARKRQGQVAWISIITVVLVTVLSLSFSYLNFNFEWIAVSVLIGTLMYTLLQSRLGYQILKSDQTDIHSIIKIIPIGGILAVFCFLLGSFTNNIIIGGLIGVVIFSLINREQLRSVLFFTMSKLGWKYGG